MSILKLLSRGSTLSVSCNLVRCLPNGLAYRRGAAGEASGGAGVSQPEWIHPEHILPTAGFDLSMGTQTLLLA